jgi:hypothetical protein
MNPFGYQTLTLNPCVFALRPDLAAGSDHAMPWQSGGTPAHRCRNLPWASADHAGNITVGQDAASGYAPDETVDSIADIFSLISTSDNFKDTNP